MSRHQNDMEFNFAIYIFSVSEGKEQLNAFTACKTKCSTSTITYMMGKNELYIPPFHNPPDKGSSQKKKTLTITFTKSSKNSEGD